MTQPDKSYSAALESAERARGAFIGLTHRLPEDTSQPIIRLWTQADDAIVAFIRALREAAAP